MIVFISIIIFFLVTTTVTRKLLKAAASNICDTAAWSGLRASQEVRNLLGGQEKFESDVNMLLQESKGGKDDRNRKN